MRKYFDKSKNKNKSLQNLWNTPKADLRGKFIAIQAYHKKEEKKSNKQCNLQQKVIVKGRIKPKVSKRKEIIKIRMEIN